MRYPEPSAFRTARHVRKLGMRKLAELAGCRYSTISAVEKGQIKVDPSSKFFQKMVDVLDFPPSFFFIKHERVKLAGHDWNEFTDSTDPYYWSDYNQ